MLDVDQPIADPTAPTTDYDYVDTTIDEQIPVADTADA